MDKSLIFFVTFILFFSVGKAEEISLSTEDGFTLPSTLKTPKKDNGAGIILIHQGGSNRGEWEFMHDKLLGAGYVILSYDIRGMGASPDNNGMGKVVENIYNAPDQAPLDLKAAIERIKTVPGIDSARIGILGASVGGNLAVVGSATMDIKTAVSISGKTEAAQNLAGRSDIKMQSVYYISSMEASGARATWAEEMFNMTEPPREIAISPNEEGHGVTILKDIPILQDQIVSWFRKNL
tara:strand:- start:253 stop:966 length:714 start_codon:yes stop_codon:yes gene_type:complete